MFCTLVFLEHSNACARAFLYPRNTQPLLCLKSRSHEARVTVSGHSPLSHRLQKSLSTQNHGLQHVTRKRFALERGVHVTWYSVGGHIETPGRDQRRKPSVYYMSSHAFSMTGHPCLYPQMINKHVRAT